MADMPRYKKSASLRPGMFRKAQEEHKQAQNKSVRIYTRNIINYNL